MRHPGLLACVVCIGVSVIAVATPGSGARGAPAPKHRGVQSIPRPEPSLESIGDPYMPPPPLTTSSSAQPRVGDFVSVQVNVTEAGANTLSDAANEPSLAVDPLHPDRMAIGWRQFDNVASNFRQAGWAYSQDGGRTWHPGGTIQPGVFRSDPVLGYDAQGAFFYSSLTQQGSVLPCTVFRSTDGGTTWSSGVSAFGGDKQWLTVDRTAGSGHDNVYQAWSTAGSVSPRVFTRSIDDGASFPATYTLPQNPRWGTMDVAADGTLYVAGVSASNLSRIYVDRSSNASNKGVSPTFEQVTLVNLGGSVTSFAPSGPNPDGLLGQVWVAVDKSTGPRAGWVYLVCSLDPPDTDALDVMFSRSIDRGATWSTPVRLNDDASGNWNWFATLAVAPDGRIDVVWNDTRHTGVANRSELFYCSSSDGGTTWSANTQLSPEWDSWLGWPSQNKIGDYYHMVSDRVGADVAWAATFSGEQDVYFLRIGDRDCNGNGVGDSADIAAGTSTDWNQNGRPDECEGLKLSDASHLGVGPRLLQNAPNPFAPDAAASTSIPFETARGGGFRLRIYDVAGRLVRTLGGSATAGRNVLSWDGRDQTGNRVGAGIYLYRIEAPGLDASRRMVVVR